MRVLLFIAELIRPVIWIFFLISAKFRERLAFERSYQDQFENKDPKDLVVHVSSEGELELVMPVLEYALAEKKQVLLLFTSPSVVGKAEKLKSHYHEQVSISLLRLCSFLPFSNVMAMYPECDRFIMVRYDFFPELLRYGVSKSKKFILIAATLKGKEELHPWKESFYRLVYSFFDLIVCSTNRDKQLLEKWVDPYRLRQFEFRIPRILKRTGEISWLEKKRWYLSLFHQCGLFPRERRLILGSCWKEDLGIFAQDQMQNEVANGEWFILIAPHLLDEGHIQQIMVELRNLLPKGAAIQVLSGDEEEISANIILSAIPGVLCELYQLFGHAYVGGGFGRSVHSVLEPFWSCERIYTGPKTHRSTEVDLVGEIDQSAIIKLEFPEDFRSSLVGIESVDWEKRKKVAVEIIEKEELILKSLF